MKSLRIIAAILLAGVVIVFAYANLRTLTLAEKLKKVYLTSFILDGNLTAEQKKGIETSVSKTEGVTACTIGTGNTATIIYYPDQVSEPILARLLSNDGSVAVRKKQLATSGGCPVPKFRSTVNRFMSALDLRD